MLKLFRATAAFFGTMLAILLLLSGNSFAYSTDTSTQYYTVVDTPQWSEMTRPERVAACQLSDEELRSLTTDELVRVVLDNPFFIDALAFNTIHEGFLRVLNESTALQELLNRGDGANALVAQYDATTDEMSLSKNTTSSIDGNLWKLEILLAQPEITSLLDEQQVTEIFEIAVAHQRLTGIFQSAMLENDAFLTTFTTSAYVKTPNGNNVLVYVWEYTDVDFTPAEKANHAAAVATAYPDTIKLRDATRKYNCHSYAWYSTSSSNTRWMPYPGAFITDGSYPELTKLTTSVGNRIVYYDTVTGTYGTPTHTAVIYSYQDYPKSRRTFVCDSKWGSLGLYRHDSADCPYAYEPAPNANPSPYDIKYFT